MKRLLPFGTLAVLVSLVGLLVRIEAVRMPQALAGGDILSTLLGDAKKDISNAMVQEADSYFHGGMDMDCHRLNGHDRHPDDEDDHGHAHDVEDENHHEGSFDPWRWINSHIRAPEIDRHLSGDKAVEMMPWFWVAVKADPHNVMAWSTAWYTASHMMTNDVLALQIAVEGQRLNPGSLEMASLLGRSYRNPSTRDDEKAEAMFRAVVEMAGQRTELEDNDYLAFFYAVGHLADVAKKRNDSQGLTSLLESARRINPDHHMIRFIESMLEAR